MGNWISLVERQIIGQTRKWPTSSQSGPGVYLQRPKSPKDSDSSANESDQASSILPYNLKDIVFGAETLLK